jgi:hypothetical protein
MSSNSPESDSSSDKTINEIVMCLENALDMTEYMNCEEEEVVAAIDFVWSILFRDCDSDVIDFNDISDLKMNKEDVDELIRTMEEEDQTTVAPKHSEALRQIYKAILIILKGWDQVDTLG